MIASFRKTVDLPDTAPLFPLEGAMLFPRAHLPLNIFEPRYLNMVDDAMRGERMIAMVQPAHGEKDQPVPPLCKVGCVGRITSYAETDDGRFLITLKGICRFAVLRELDQTKPYRHARLDYKPFAIDLEPPVTEMETDVYDRTLLVEALKEYLVKNGMSTDWKTVEDAPLETLANALCAGCPFSPIEKQMLLECSTLKDRCETLAKLLRVNTAAFGSGGNEGTIQ